MSITFQTGLDRRAGRTSRWGRGLGILGAGLVWWAAAHSAGAVTLVPTNSVWKFWKGTAEASSPDRTAWRQPLFKDSSWPSGPAPFFYGEPLSGGTTLTDMANRYTSLFLRQPFTVTNAALFSDLALQAVCDDGFIAWINGTRVATYNATAGEPSFDSLASQNVSEPVGFATYLLAPGNYLVAGTNLLTVQVFNISSSSSDLVFDLELLATLKETDPPTIAGVVPAPGPVTQLTQLTVTFSEPVSGVDAGDLRINGIPATGLTGSGAVYTFSFAAPLPGSVQVSWSQTSGIFDQASPPNPFNPSGPNTAWMYLLSNPNAPTLVSVHPPPDLTVRSLSQIEIQFSEPVADVDAEDLLINGQPASSRLGFGAGPYLFEFTPITNGPVAVTWRSGHGIVGMSTPPNVFTGDGWLYQVQPQALIGDLVINEIVAENTSGLADEESDREDWIEIFNRGAASVNLSGWSLTDEPAQPRKWVFPAVTLPARQYLVVFASGKDRKPILPGSRLHANFKLAIEGEYLGLFTPESPPQAVSELAPRFPEQRNDYAYARMADGNYRYVKSPTPGAANSESPITDVVDPVHFSAARGYYRLPFNLSLATPTPGAAIRYTTNGSVPTATNGVVYTEPIPVSATRIIRAAAFKTNGLPSRVETHTYLYGMTAQRQLLPALSLVTASNNLYGATGIMETNPRNTTKHGLAWERPVSTELIWPQDNRGFQIDAGLRIQGGGYIRPQYDYRGSTPPFNKYSFRLYFRSDYGPGSLAYPLLPDCAVQTFDRIVLRAGMNDPTNPFLRDELARRLLADTGQVSSHGTFVNLFLNGVYKGYYNPTERVDAHFLQSWHGGGDQWDLLAQSGEVREGTAVEFNALRSLVSSKDPSVMANYLEISRRFDLVNFVDYLLVNIYAAMGDWPWNNWRAGRERATGGKFRFYMWDGEWSFGSNNPYTWNTLNNELAGDTEIGTLYRRLKLSREFRLLFADRAHRHLFNDGALTDARIRSRYNWLKSQVAGSITGFNDTIGTSWIPRRRPYVLQHLATAGLLGSSNAPVFNQFGGRVAPGFPLTMTCTNGTIYYTTNGSDPRVPFTSAAAAQASAYVPGKPLVLTQDTLVKARTLQDTNWSALSEATFQVAQLGLNLTLSEIMYRPPGNEAGEFIELLNYGEVPLDLSGWSFEGVEFRFPEGTPLLPAGGRLVLASSLSPTTFAQRYPKVVVAGYFHGSLANAGERLAIKDRQGRTLAAVTYGNLKGWPPAADGAGFSLELINPYGELDDPANWQTSVQPGGSPGLGTASVSPPRLLLNEIMAGNTVAAEPGGAVASDWIELFNSGTAPANLEGWSISDDGDPRKYVLPPKTTLPAGGYLVIWCDSIASSPGLHSGFGLDWKGESLFLYDAQTNRVEAFSFGRQVAGYSVGRTGAEGGWNLTEPTPGGPNEAAVLAPASSLVLNEFMANPPPGGDDWIELYNSDTNLPVALHGLYLGTSNAVHQLRSLSFVAPGGYALLLADDQAGPNHLSFKLPAVGGAIKLMDDTGAELQQVVYTSQREGTSSGRLPNGIGAWTILTASVSPGSPNYLLANSGPFLNEILARNLQAVTNSEGRVVDWIELYNPTATAVALSGMKLAIGADVTDAWEFPAGTQIPSLGFLLVECDEERPATTQTGTHLNVGRSLPGEGGWVSLLDRAGLPVDQVRYGRQIPDVSIGKVNGSWALLSRPSPGLPNAAPALLGNPASLKINEWMASVSQDVDWFEIYNPESQPVALAGLVLTDDPSIAGQTNYLIGPLSYIAAKGFVTWKADGQRDQGDDHVPFRLDALGETLRLYHTNLVVIDSVDLRPQTAGIAQGRFPSGGATLLPFPASASPGEDNYLPLTNVVINEVLAHTDPPLEDALELLNISPSPVDVSGWWIGNSGEALQQFQIPAGTVLAPGAYQVFYQYQFNPLGDIPGVALSSARGGQIYLSAVDAQGNLSGYRTKQEFGATANGVSLGRWLTSTGLDFVPLSRRTFGADQPDTLAQFRTGAGAPNAYPLVGPVVINEIMYHPPDLADAADNAADEFIELYNFSDHPVPLYDPLWPTNAWKLRGGVEFDFPTGVRLAAGGCLLLVNFNPLADTHQLAAFRAKYPVSTEVQLFGPYRGKLGNGGGRVELWCPDPPETSGPKAGWVPYVKAEIVEYSDHAPWPEAADGSGASLQRRSPVVYGNDPINWKAGLPSPGRPADAFSGMPPAILSQPVGRWALPGEDIAFNVSASGAPPLNYQWQFNGLDIAGATNESLVLLEALPGQSGNYSVMVSNSAGSTPSAIAPLSVEPGPRLYWRGSVDPNHLQLRLIAPGGMTVKFQASTNLVDWVTISTNLSNPGVLLLSDPAASGFSTRFYRVVPGP